MQYVYFYNIYELDGYFNLLYIIYIYIYIYIYNEVCIFLEYS